MESGQGSSRRSWGILGVMLAGLLLGCSGGAAGPEPEHATSPGSDEDAERQAALERLRARQEAACTRVGDVFFDCAVADARATMSPEELEKLDVAELEPQYKAEFMVECTASDMSLRQVKVYEDCLANVACDVFVTCLDAAKPRPQTQPQAQPQTQPR